MKYELEPDNRNCPDEELLADLRRVAKQTGNQSLTMGIYGKHGRFHPATYKKRFGSWNKALSRSGLSVSKRNNIPKEELLDDLRSVALKLQAQTVTTGQYNMYGSFSVTTIARVFDSWSSALNQAGLHATGFKPKATEEELFGNMALVWEHVGRQPKEKDLHPPVSRYGADAYTRRFGSWRRALEAFVDFMNSEKDRSDIDEKPPEVGTELPMLKQEVIRNTERCPSWRLRFLVLQRDNFACRFCGASPAKDPSVNLHIDHIVPWSKGGETILPNLQTLCDRCNIGKSDLQVKATGLY